MQNVKYTRNRYLAHYNIINTSLVQIYIQKHTHEGVAQSRHMMDEIKNSSLLMPSSGNVFFFGFGSREGMFYLSSLYIYIPSILIPFRTRCRRRRHQHLRTLWTLSMYILYENYSRRNMCVRSSSSSSSEIMLLVSMRPESRFGSGRAHVYSSNPIHLVFKILCKYCRPEKNTVCVRAFSIFIMSVYIHALTNIYIYICRVYVCLHSSAIYPSG